MASSGGNPQAPLAGYDAQAAAEFCSHWLPAWTGNDPGRLASFYTEDAFYSDPARPAGIEGHDALLGYFTRLLARYPAWVWTHRRSLPVPEGFLNFWSATVDGSEESQFDGVCVVRLRDGLIFRNEVFFDASALKPR